MRKKAYKVKEKRGFIFTFFKNFFKLFKKKPQIINLNNEKLNSGAIYVANHSAASGPFTYELFFPVYFIPWGTHEMCGNYKMRWNYLFHTFYRQKLGYSKFKSFLLATSFALFSKLLYNATGLIGTYKDARLKTTFQRSFDVLNKNISLLIFPENSSSGYFDKPTQYHEGFISLAKLYHKKTSIDLPVYNVYYSKDKNKIVIDKPIKINELLSGGKTELQISELFLKNSHLLYEKHIK